MEGDRARGPLFLLGRGHGGPLIRFTLLDAFAALSFAALLGVVSGVANADTIYLNDQNITVSLGSSMAAEPFENQTTAISLANVIDAPSADASESHVSPTTHVWVSGGSLELDFDFGVEFDLTALHFWNYFGEAFDVDNIDFVFSDASMSFVGELLNVEPALGSGGSNPIFAEDFALSFPSKVRFVNVVLTGTNGEVDFNNIGFTAIPEPSTALLLASGLLAMAVGQRRRASRV